MYMPSAAPRSTTLVSPATIWTSAASAACAMASTSARRSTGGQALLQDQGEGERRRARSRYGQVVDGSVHREIPDRATREAERLDDEGIGREREPAPADLDRGRVPLASTLGAERGLEQALDHALRGLAARAVGHVDALVAELAALGAGRLDDPEDALLAVSHGH